MSTTKYILDKIKIESALHDIFAHSTGELVTVTYKGSEVTLAAALSGILAEVAALPSSDNVATQIGSAISELIGGAPETYDTLKEIADYIAEHEDVVTALNTAIGNKAEKTALEALQATVNTLSGSNHSHANKAALDNITAEKISEWNNKAPKTNATPSQAGLMSADDKKKFDELRGVRYGTEVPADMQSGEMFVRVVN